jgi:hypothetical protein
MFWIFRAKPLNADAIQKLVEENQEQLLTGWNEFFND